MEGKKDKKAKAVEERVSKEKIVDLKAVKVESHSSTLQAHHVFYGDCSWKMRSLRCF